jgi:serine/threonine-protein kinase
LHRAALAKALNSLSWKARIVRPEAVDAQQTIFALDVRDLDWDRGNLWQELMKAYPYGLKYRNHPDPALQRLSDEIEALTGCDMPLVRSDWFVATATRPPLYHTLLRLPTDAKELEKQLDVDIAANFKEPTPQRIARGAMHKSGVSGQNRLVERHSAKHGAYWKSYDFLPGRARSRLTRFPLGPLNLFDAGKHPFPSQAFEHDGGELIFNLPNGLQAYLLINGKDQRIDEGPIAVVGDEQKTAGTAAIVTGVSCMSCHKHGMISFKDVVRDSNSVFGQAERMVKLLYPEKSKMDELVREDEDRFMAALEKTISPFLRVGDDKQKPIREFPEPVGEVARLHRLGYLDLKTAALELDLEDPEVIRTTVGETKLKRLGLDALLRGGVIGRLDWEAVDGVSLMQELARELRCTPFAVPRD